MKKRSVNLFSVVLLLALLVAPCSAAQAASPKTVRLPIIMYHQISKNPSACNAFTISPETFEQDIRYLAANGYTSVTTAQMLDYCQGKETLPGKPILITFDDGYESFEPYAKPVLEQYGMSAVLAIVGQYADTYTKTEDHHVSYSYFSWNALAQLQKSPAVELAVHTYDMHHLRERKGCKIKSGESNGAYRQALNGDLERVEEQFKTYVGNLPCVFAYPYGFYCKEAKEILRERGYQVLFTCEEKVNVLTGNPEELMSLGRFNRPSGVGQAQFFRCLEAK